MMFYCDSCKPSFHEIFTTISLTIIITMSLTIFTTMSCHYIYNNTIHYIYNNKVISLNWICDSTIMFFHISKVYNLWICFHPWYHFTIIKTLFFSFMGKFLSPLGLKPRNLQTIPNPLLLEVGPVNRFISNKHDM